MMAGTTVYYWIGILIGGLFLLLAIPIVNRIRHPEQKPLAAYMIFITLFSVSAMLLFNAVVWLVPSLFQEPLALALILLIIIFSSALLATWQAARPPWRQGPPN